MISIKIYISIQDQKCVVHVQCIMIINYIKQTVIAIRLNKKKKKAHQNAAFIKDFYINWDNNCDEQVKFGWPEQWIKGYALHMERSSKIIEMYS